MPERYRSNLINWGMLPLRIAAGDLPFKNGDYIFIPGVRKDLEAKKSEFIAYRVDADGMSEFTLIMDALTDDERLIILDGCLINYNRSKMKG